MGVVARGGARTRVSIRIAGRTMAVSRRPTTLVLTAMRARVAKQRDNESAAGEGAEGGAEAEGDGGEGDDHEVEELIEVDRTRYSFLREAAAGAHTRCRVLR